MTGKQLRIERINNGLVLDHIKAGMGIEILKLFPTKLLKTKIDYASYVESPRLGMKDIIKIENLGVDPKILMKMTLLAPDITISTIRDGLVLDKLRPTIPPEIEGVITCQNPKCVTRNEHYLITRFRVAREEDGRFRMQCKYCEHIFIN